MSFDPGFGVCPLLWRGSHSNWSLSERSISNHETLVVQTVSSFLICPWAWWMILVFAPPQQHTSVHKVYCTTLGNDPWTKKKKKVRDKLAQLLWLKWTRNTLFRYFLSLVGVYGLSCYAIHFALGPVQCTHLQSILEMCVSLDLLAPQGSMK